MFVCIFTLSFNGRRNKSYRGYKIIVCDKDSISLQNNYFTDLTIIGKDNYKDTCSHNDKERLKGDMVPKGSKSHSLHSCSVVHLSTTFSLNVHFIINIKNSFLWLLIHHYLPISFHIVSIFNMIRGTIRELDDQNVSPFFVHAMALDFDCSFCHHNCTKKSK